MDIAIEAHEKASEARELGEQFHRLKRTAILLCVAVIVSLIPHLKLGSTTIAGVLSVEAGTTAIGLLRAGLLLSATYYVLGFLLEFLYERSKGADFRPTIAEALGGASHEMSEAAKHLESVEATFAEVMTSLPSRFELMEFLESEAFQSRLSTAFSLAAERGKISLADQSSALLMPPPLTYQPLVPSPTPRPLTPEQIRDDLRSEVQKAANTLYNDLHRLKGVSPSLSDTMERVSHTRELVEWKLPKLVKELRSLYNRSTMVRSLQMAWWELGSLVTLWLVAVAWYATDRAGYEPSHVLLRFLAGS